jgi:hypothetical protein
METYALMWTIIFIAALLMTFITKTEWYKRKVYPYLYEEEKP